MFTEILKLTLEAKYATRNEKIPLLQKISKWLDNLKYFLTILWEVKGIDNSQYTRLSTDLINIGNMLGKWLSSCKKTPPTY